MAAGTSSRGHQKKGLERVFFERTSSLTIGREHWQLPRDWQRMEWTASRRGHEG